VVFCVVTPSVTQGRSPEDLDFTLVSNKRELSTLLTAYLLEIITIWCNILVSIFKLPSYGHEAINRAMTTLPCGVHAPEELSHALT